MPRYNKDNVKGLKELLYNSYVHDAELENAEFDFKEDSIKITLFNPIFGAKINFTFLNIETSLTIKGDWQGERATIVSLTVEEDFSYLQKYLPNHGEYMDSQDDSFGTHKRFAIYVFKNVIAPSDALLDYYEDCNMEWAADIQVANTMLLKTMEDIKEENPSGFEIPSLYKDEGDREFAVRLLRETEKGSAQYKAMIEQKAENWDSERIAMVDFILMEMAIAEFMNFPSIPTKVTLNEYIEISKDYSTAKSRIFVNGILDRILAWLEADGKIKKAGRGLM